MPKSCAICLSCASHFDVFCCDVVGHHSPVKHMFIFTNNKEHCILAYIGIRGFTNECRQLLTLRDPFSPRSINGPTELGGSVLELPMVLGWPQAASTINHEVWDQPSRITHRFRCLSYSSKRWFVTAVNCKPLKLLYRLILRRQFFEDSDLKRGF